VKIDIQRLYLDQSAISFTAAVQQPDRNSPCFDFEFHDGDARTKAVLSFDPAADAYFGVVFVVESANHDFDGPDVETAYATPEQLALLRESLPSEWKNAVEASRAAVNAAAGTSPTP
jgi:hypothetical protein